MVYLDLEVTHISPRLGFGIAIQSPLLRLEKKQFSLTKVAGKVDSLNRWM